MRKDFPTTELYFTFAFTHCKLTVYTDNEAFARKVLEARGAQFLTASDNDSWQEWDTRLLLAVICETLPKMLSDHFSKPGVLSKGFAEAVGM